MVVTRIVTNIATDKMDEAKSFYGEVLGLELAMDHG